MGGVSDFPVTVVRSLPHFGHFGGGGVGRVGIMKLVTSSMPTAYYSKMPYSTIDA
jgi:hypothetical protein